MRRWKGASRWGTAVLAVCLMAAAAGCGQLFSASASGSSATTPASQQSLAQRVTQLEATVSELQAAVAGLSGNQGGPAAATSSGTGGAQAMVTASYLNVRQSPDVHSQRVGVLKQDTVVSVMTQSGNWSQIKYGPVSGWVDSQWLAAPSGTGTTAGGAASGTSTGNGTSKGSTSKGSTSKGSTSTNGSSGG